MDYYNTIASGYNALHREEQMQKLSLIKPHIPNNASILDVGCGSGVSSTLQNVIGIDPSRQLLRQAPMPTVEGIAESLPFKNHSFDVVISITALHHCKDVQKTLQEMHRVGRDRVIISMLKKAKSFSSWEKQIHKEFDVQKILEHPIDRIFICSKQNRG